MVLQPAAMFKVLRADPPIPDNLSPEGKDFLRCCFKRNPAERPTASKLLEHSFIQNSNPPRKPTNAIAPDNHHGSTPSFAAIKSPVSLPPFFLSTCTQYPKFQL